MRRASPRRSRANTARRRCRAWRKSASNSRKNLRASAGPFRENPTMRLIQFREPGPPAVLQCLDVPIPEPGPGEVLIRAHAIGVGMPDCLIRAGTYSHMPPLPATPGTELAGTIEKIGSGVTTRQVGQRVYTTARERPHRGGHYAQYVATPAEATFLLPDSVDFEAAAALANYQVAYHIFNDALHLRKGERSEEHTSEL